MSGFRDGDPSIEEVADAIQELGFACTECGDCCTGDAEDPHVATLFPSEIRRLQAETGELWDDVARPMPFGVGDDGTGETFEWSLQVDDCGSCAFHDPTRGCTVYRERPLICRTYPFQLDPAAERQGVARAGPVVASECEGLGAEIDREDALELAAAVIRRAAVEETESQRLMARYSPVTTDEGVIVHDSEGAKTADGRSISEVEHDNY